jgi:NAD(P)-dependent dehydrogenase (short-subunit alcohol dehydrogenase family)
MDTTEDFSPYRSDGKLYGFVCVVTGASAPVGQAIIEELAAHGAASIYACDKTADANLFSSLASTLSTKHPNTKLIPYPFDVTSEDATLVLIDEALAAFGRLDIWVCSTSLLGPATIHDTTPDTLTQLIQAHSLAPFFALKWAPAAMGKLTEKKGSYPNAVEKRQRYGSIIVVGGGEAVGPGLVMAEFAALGVVKAGVGCLRGTGVRMNFVRMGVLEGQATQTPNGLERVGRPQEVARVAGFLASGFSSYVNGATLVVDGGAS